MRTKSKKAKGRRLQNWVRDELLKRFPKLTDSDVVCAIMGERGIDVKLSSKAKKFIPFAIECKNQDTFKNLYNVIKYSTNLRIIFLSATPMFNDSKEIFVITSLAFDD